MYYEFVKTNGTIDVFSIIIGDKTPLKVIINELNKFLFESKINVTVAYHDNAKEMLWRLYKEMSHNMFDGSVYTAYNKPLSTDNFIIELWNGNDYIFYYDETNIIKSILEDIKKASPELYIKLKGIHAT